MKKSISLIVATFFMVTFFCLGVSCRRDVASAVDLEGLRSSGDDWEQIHQNILPDGAQLRFNHNKWLMYFLHWRPLTEEKKNISVDYVRKQMLSFWGPNMPFTITSEGGKTEVSGHEAFYIDGTIYEGTIHTRFIIWNCPETNRQFIADCNINVGVGTPIGLLELQYEITGTISCHGQGVTNANPVLTQPYESKQFNLSFFIPENWRTNVYSDKAWFPEGQTETNGTLWTLMTDSEKFIDLFWKEIRQKAEEDVFREFLRQFEKTSYEWKNIHYELKGLEAKGLKAEKGYFVGEGTYQFLSRVKVQGQERTAVEPYVFKAFLWTKGRRTYFLAASMISRQSLWGRPTDLTPAPGIFEKYVRKEVLPRILVFNKIYPEK